MNKEIVINGIIKRLSEECELRPSEVLVLINYIKKLEQRIDKSKEYIKTAIEEGDYLEDDLDTDITPASHDKYVNSNDLLEILNGEDYE